MSDRLHVLVVRNEPVLPHHAGMFSALSEVFDVATHKVIEQPPRSIREIGDFDSFDAILWFDVDYDQLREMPSFDWGPYGGARLWFDLDAYQSFRSIANSRHRGTYPETFERLGFHMFLTTGLETRDLLTDSGVPAFWVPKAYDADAIFDMGHEGRTGIGHFGSRYPARQLMLRKVRRAGIEVEDFTCQWPELNQHLNRFLACIVCNMDLRGSDRLPVRAWSYIPDFLQHERLGIEPMAKNFEIAGAGCAPFFDYLPELEKLGFEDHVTMVSYTSFDELVDKLRHYMPMPEQLRRIGRYASEFVRTQHTWRHRAELIEEMLRAKQYLAG